MKNILLPTFLTVRCMCKKTINVRTKEQEKEVTCWHCMRKVHVHLGHGKGNLRVSIDGRNIIPNSVIQ